VRAVAQALHGILKNAQDACSSAGHITLEARSQAGAVEIEVRDSGSGMPSDVLARAGEPFFTTKQPGSGMGLGIFLSRSVVERLGGSLELRSAIGRGTTATLRLPRPQRG
jgi:two-component system sensor histidine kinase RegB